MRKIEYILNFFFSRFSQTGPQTGLFGTPAQTSPFANTAAGTSTGGTGNIYNIKYLCLYTFYDRYL